MMQTLESDRLLLRPFTLEDVEPSYQMNLRSEVSRYTADGGVQPREVILDRIQNHVMGDYKRYGYGRHAVVHKADNRFIGFCGLKFLPELNETDLGYRFLPEYWGQGIATEAGKLALDFGFETLELDQIIGLALPDNVASLRVLEKLGMHFIEHFEEDGMQVAKYAMTRDETRSK